MGKFGGDTDNWMWPRQTCDFSVFRIYADKNNKPAEYSKDNVPYHPQHWARVSMDGYQEGSFSMTMGYPGSTSRYLSSYGIQERYAENAIRAQVRGVKQQVMKRHMDASEAVRIKYDSKYAQSSNYWKNSIGMNKCIDSIGLIRQKQQFEAQLQQWMDSTGHYKGQLDFEKMQRLYQQRLQLSKTLMYWAESFARNDELAKRAISAQRSKSTDKGKAALVEFRGQQRDLRPGYRPRDSGRAAEELPRAHHPRGDTSRVLSDHLHTQFGGDYQKFADHLYAKSRLMKNGKWLYTHKS